MEINEKWLEEKFKTLEGNIKTTVDDRFKAFTAGLESSKKHDQPAPATISFISETKSSINVINGDIGEIKEILKTVPTQEGMKLMINEAICLSLKECDKKYAGKTTENIVNSAIVLILLAFMGAVIAQVIITKSSNSSSFIGGEKNASRILQGESQGYFTALDCGTM